jgi:hypothetical protein
MVQRARRQEIPDDYGGGRIGFHVRGRINEASIVRPEVRVWLGPETRIGVEPVFAHGGMDAQALRFEGDIGHRTRGIDEGVRSHTGIGGADRTIAKPFSGRYPGVEGLLPRSGAAVLTRELARLSRAAIDLGALSNISDIEVGRSL